MADNTAKPGSNNRGRKRKMSRAEWMDRFGFQLLQLQPSIGTLMAATTAVEAHPESAGANPERAARAFLAMSRPSAARGGHAAAAAKASVGLSAFGTRPR
ncbi:hypothetical protein BH11PSE9_BH11PSE9_06280 [soil metagenome]